MRPVLQAQWMRKMPAGPQYSAHTCHLTIGAMQPGAIEGQMPPQSPFLSHGWQNPQRLLFDNWPKA
eukprot:3487125-Amphidinium_carterae.2